jgi:formylglycine-generating enzyme required for sulfatase activity
MSYQPGEKIIEKYRIERLLGQGAFGEVYLVTHLSLGVLRAVKLLRRNAPGVGSAMFGEVLKRFQLEARLGAQLNSQAAHPHLLQVFDFYAGPELAALEMEYAAGGSLAQKLADAGKVLPVEAAVRIAHEVAHGLGALHAADIVHRDLKPANILFDAAGHARLADLGLAQLPDGASLRSDLGSSAERHPGTPAYMSPEQAETVAVLRPPSDVYALGLVLFEMLSGRNYTYLRPDTRVSQLRAGIPLELDGLLARMLARNPQERPWDGAELAQALSAMWKTTQPAPAPGGPRPQPLVVKSPPPPRPPARMIELAPGIGMEFMRVPAGEFVIGSERAENEKPAHTLNLPEYLLARTPVTNQQYAIFRQASQYRPIPAHWLNGSYPPGMQDHPVVHISWQDANEFCRWLSHKSGAAVRLPGEAAWEKAARGSDGRAYPWGDQKPGRQHCNSGKNENGTTPVGQYSPLGDSPYGCVDMVGNTWEWVRSAYKPYPYNAQDGREDVNSAQPRVLRGGSWYYTVSEVRCSYRVWDKPENSSAGIGFRCLIE